MRENNYFKIKYSDFTQQTRSKTLPYFIADKTLIVEVVKELLPRTNERFRAVVGNFFE
jgi:nucleotidyltransferase/DNA polymerase involved in DNA repair